MYLFGALLIIAGAFVLLSQLGILGLLLTTLNLPAIVLFALVLIIVGIVLIRGASLIAYSPDHQRKDRNELDYKDLTFEDQDPWEYKKRDQSLESCALSGAFITLSYTLFFR